MKWFLVAVLLVLLVTALCLLLWGGEGVLPWWGRALGVITSLVGIVVVIGARDDRI